MATMHQVLYGKKPTPLQRRLYANPDKFRGFSNDEKDIERFEAVFALALLRARDSKEPVVIILPKAHTAWALEQIRILARTAFQNIPGKEGKAELKQTLYRISLSPGPQVFRQPQPPKHWVMFGHRGGPWVLPSWAKGTLIDENPS